MPFRPKPNDTVSIEGIQYHFTEHPAAPGMAYGQTGRRATVYQVRAQDGSLHALKVFTKAWRDQRNAISAARLRSFARLPGLQVCERTVFTPGDHAELLGTYPDLEYAVLMAWVSGETWQEVQLNGRPLTVEQSKALGRVFLDILERMEQAGVAHTDLSGPNVLLHFSQVEVALVDVEDIYGPGLVRPQKVGGGSSGYAHKTAPGGVWDANADRFAGAILLAEMLGWCDERVRRIGYGEQYFDPGEVQQSSERYQVLLSVLRERWGSGVADRFARTWYSETLEDCPSFQEWQSLLNPVAPVSVQSAPEQLAQPKVDDEQTTRVLEDGIVHMDERIIATKVQEAEYLISRGRVDEGITALEELYREAPSSVSASYGRALFKRGRFKERDGHLEEAQESYKASLEIVQDAAIRAGLLQAIAHTNELIAQRKVKSSENLMIGHQLDQALVELEEAYRIAPQVAAGAYTQALMRRAVIKAEGDNREGSREDYRIALQVAPEGELRDELLLILTEEDEPEAPVAAEPIVDDALSMAIDGEPEPAAALPVPVVEPDVPQEENQDLKDDLVFEIAPPVTQWVEEEPAVMPAQSEPKTTTPIVTQKLPPSQGGLKPVPPVQKAPPNRRKPRMPGWAIGVIVLVVLIGIAGILVVGGVLGQMLSPAPVSYPTELPATSIVPTVIVPTSTMMPVDNAQPVLISCRDTRICQQVSVSAADAWQPSEILIQPGERFRISYVSGLWAPGPGVDIHPFAAGVDGAIVATGGINALVGKIGESVAPFLVEDGVQTTATGTGGLYFSINDLYTADNSGSIVVLVEVWNAATPTGMPTQSYGTATPTPTLDVVGQATVIVDNANIRSGPGINFVPILDTAERGTILDVFGRSSNGDWLAIWLPDMERLGWIAVSVVSFDFDIDTIPIIPSPPTPTPLPPTATSDSPQLPDDPTNTPTPIDIVDPTPYPYP